MNSQKSSLQDEYEIWLWLERVLHACEVAVEHVTAVDE